MPRLTALGLLVLAAAAGSPPALNAQTVASPPALVPQATEDQVADQLRQEHTPVWDTPPTLVLTPESPNAHPGRVWILATDAGLHLWGRVEAPEKGFRWPEEKSEMAASDHVEVWLAAATDVPMPAIGWGNQFGPIELASAQDCAARLGEENNAAPGQVARCEGWYGRQVQYRQALKRLFVRQWMAARQGSPACCAPRTGRHYEDFAASAWAELSASLFADDLPLALQPRAEDGFTVEMTDELRPETRQDAAGNPYQYNARSGYRFHIFIPYGAFPPTRQLALQEISLAVDVYAAAPDGGKMGARSSTAPGHTGGEAANFNALRLAAPRAFTVTPCEQKLEQTDMYDQAVPAWFFPTGPGTDAGAGSGKNAGRDAWLRSTFALINPAQGYLYEPGGNSPEPVAAHYFWKRLAGGATVCGPDLGWRKGTAVRRTAFEIDEKTLQTKALPDGWELLRSGPVTSTLSKFGSGQCGACLEMGMEVYAVSPEGEIVPALQIEQSLSGQGGNPQGADLAIAPDWKRVTLYRNFEDYEEKDPESTWDSVTYCLEGHAYTKCAESKVAKPPEPPNFKELRGEN